MVKKSKILVIGSSGQLGASIIKNSKNYPNFELITPSSSQFDITNFEMIDRFINKINIDAVINCSAFTNVKSAEKNKHLADLLNHKSVENISIICSKKKISLIHISSDYVFDGNKISPYHESDITNPINHYGLTKLLGENKMLSAELINSATHQNIMALFKNKNNFVTKIISKILKENSFTVINDEFGSPTNSNDLAKAILNIIPMLKNTKPEIYNFSNIGICSRYEFALEIESFFRNKNLISSVSTNKKTDLKRPKFSALNISKISEHFNLDIPDWKSSLKQFLNNNYFEYSK